MLISVSRRRRWVPDLLGNSELPADQQLVIEYDKPNAVQRNSWQRRVATYKADDSVHVYTDTDVKAILEGANVSIVNLTVNMGTKKSADGKDVDDVRQITTGSELATTPSDLCFLIATQLAQKIMEVEVTQELLKN